MITTQDRDQPTLILIRGLPGSGKSYLATALQEALGKDIAITLDPDATDYTSRAYTDLSAALTAEGIEEKFHPYRFLRSQAYEAITRSKVIIWNQGFTNLDGFTKTVVNLQTYATDHDTKLALLVIEVEVNPAIARRRVAIRAAQGGHDVPAEAFARFISDYGTFAGQGYHPIVVNGEDDVSVSVASVMQALQELWDK